MKSTLPNQHRRKHLTLAEGAPLFGLILLILLPVFCLRSDYILQVATHAVLLANLALAWNVLGISGSISLGHAAFFGIGAYGSALLSLRLGLSVWLTIPLGGFLTTIVSMMMGLLCLRLRGAYFALATLAFVEIPRVITDNWDELTRGSMGLLGIPGLPTMRLGPFCLDIGASSVGSYYFLLSCMVTLLGVMTLLFRSNVGLALRAIREEEVAAQAVGIHVQHYRFLSLLLSAFFTGICGAIYAHLIRYVEPGLVYGLHFSAIPMILAICGGRFTIIGPALAAMVLYPLDQFIFHPLLPAGHEFLYGAVIVLVILFMPSGFWGHFQRETLVSVKIGSIE